MEQGALPYNFMGGNININYAEFLLPYYYIIVALSFQ